MDDDGWVSGTADTLHGVHAGDRGATQTWLLLGAVAAVVVAIAVVLAVGYGRDAGDTDDVVAAPSVTAAASTAASEPPVAATTPDVTPTPPTSTFSAAPVGELGPVPVAQQTSEGAVEFLEWYLEMAAYAETTGETDLITRNSETNSEYATRAISKIEETYAAGRRIERTGPYSLSDINASEVDINGYIVVTFDLSDSETRLVDSTGTVVSTSAELTPLPVTAGIQWTTDRWLLTELGSDAS